MRILLTNDDGIHAPGIEAIYRELVSPTHNGAVSHEVMVVAPLTVQSATGHGITFHEPLMVQHEYVNAHMSGTAVDGRPADCMKLALAELWPEEFGKGSMPDLVVSGMNAGANVGINILYSGTVAAALEAAFLGVPSIAVSMHLGMEEPDFALGAQRARIAIDAILATGLPQKHECINVNIPRSLKRTMSRHDAIGAGIPSATDDVALPILVCPMNTHGHVDRYEKRTSPQGRSYYWASSNGFDFHETEPGSDVDEVIRGAITVTPLRYDMARDDRMAAWQERLVRVSGKHCPIA